MTGHFELGITRLTTGVEGPVYPAPEKYDSGWDIACTVVEGKATISSATGATRTLNRFDFAFVPESESHRIKNVSEADTWVVWGAVPPAENGQGPTELTSIETFKDVDPGVGASDDDIKTYWIPVDEETIGVDHFTMGLIFRPPGTEVPLHKHDPPETREAFTVVDGQMGVEGIQSNYYVLDKYDALYVPQHGQHSNRNIQADQLQYVFIESPSEPEPVFQ
jgi:quercetin dioxygenase-like cupin family protein